MKKQLCPWKIFLLLYVLYHRSIGRTDLYKGNYQQLLTSIRTQLFSLPEQTQVYSGHGMTTTIGEEKQLNPFLQAN